MCAAVTVRLAFFSAKAIRQILRGTAGAVLFSVLILLPSVFMGTPQTLMNITSRVYVSVTLVGILSSGTSWNKLTGSMRTFRLPSIFIFTLDITLKYISVLGEMCAAILTSVRLRSVGKNPQKAKALSGEYKKKQKYTLCAADIFSTFIMAGCIVLFWYLNRKI